VTRWVTEAMLVSSVERRDTGPANAPPAAAVAADFVEEEGEGAVVAVLAVVAVTVSVTTAMSQDTSLETARNHEVVVEDTVGDVVVAAVAEEVVAAALAITVNNLDIWPAIAQKSVLNEAVEVDMEAVVAAADLVVEVAAAEVAAVVAIVSATSAMVTAISPEIVSPVNRNFSQRSRRVSF